MFRLFRFIYDWFFDWSKQDNLDIFLRMYIFIFLFLHFLAFLYFLWYAYKTYDVRERSYVHLKYMWLELINVRNRSVWFNFFFRRSLRHFLWCKVQRFNENFVDIEEERWLPDETFVNQSPTFDYFFGSFSQTLHDFFRTAWEYITLYWEE